MTEETINLQPIPIKLSVAIYSHFNVAKYSIKLAGWLLAAAGWLAGGRLADCWLAG